MRYGTLVRVFALGLLAPAAGCNVYDPGLVQAGLDCTDCVHPPPRPQMNELPSIDFTPVFAMRNVRIQQTVDQAWRDIGFDLDGVNTQEAGDPQACEANPEASSSQVQLDGNGGIDNVFGARFYVYVSAQTQIVAGLDPEVAARAAHDAGDGTMIARLSDWNGTPNDEQVTVTIAQAVDGTPLPRDQVFMDPATHTLKLVSDPSTDAPPPAWNPDTPDNWWVRRDGFIGGDPDQPFQEDTTAYVTDGVIVHRLTPQPIFFRMGANHAIEVVYRDAWVTATLEGDFEDPASLSLGNITVAGRWSILDLLKTASGVELCTGDPALSLLRAEGYRWADVASNAGDDGKPGTPCDALSMAVTFESASPGDWTPSTETIVPGVPVPDYCAGTNVPTVDGGV